MFVRIVLGILLLGFGSAHARDYAVELIVFDRPNAANETEEVWNFSSQRIAGKRQKMRDLATKSIDYETLPELDDADTRSETLPELDDADSHYKILPALDNLAVISNNLVAAGYRILHMANWVQPATTYRFAPRISFGTADSSLPYGFITVYKTSLIFANINVQYSPTDFTTTNTATVTTNTRVGIDTNEYLNAEDINPTETDREPQQPHFFISEKRRLKFKEIHYLDHPLFGVIVGVWSS